MKAITLFALLFFTFSAFADICPDPQSSSLAWGETPSPWMENPYLPNSPQGDVNTRFVRVNILLKGRFTLGVSCIYKNSIGLFSIWQPVRVKRPSRRDRYWIRDASGYFCDQSIKDCHFFVSNLS